MYEVGSRQEKVVRAPVFLFTVNVTSNMRIRVTQPLQAIIYVIEKEETRNCSVAKNILSRWA